MQDRFSYDFNVRQGLLAPSLRSKFIENSYDESMRNFLDQWVLHKTLPFNQALFAVLCCSKTQPRAQHSPLACVSQLSPCGDVRGVGRAYSCRSERKSYSWCTQLKDSFFRAMLKVSPPPPPLRPAAWCARFDLTSTDRPFPQPCVSTTSINGFLDRGKMYVLSTEQFKQHLAAGRESR